MHYKAPNFKQIKKKKEKTPPVKSVSNCIICHRDDWSTRSSLVGSALRYDLLWARSSRYHQRASSSEGEEEEEE